MSDATSDRIWITGGHGFIGRHAARIFARAGHTVCGIGHGTWPEREAAEWGMRVWLNGDVSASNLSALAGLGGKPQIILHLAGGSSVGAAIAQPYEDFLRTVGSTAVLLEWMRQESPDSALVAVSSAAVYGDGHNSPISETAALKPYSPYGFHKAAMEDLCRSYCTTYGLRGLVARLFSVYGAGLRKQLLWDLCVKLSSGAGTLELGGHGNETRDWIHVEDVGNALIRLAPLASSNVPVFNVATGRGVPVRGIAQIIVEQWRAQGGRDARMAFSGRGRPGDPAYLVADNSKLGALSWEPGRTLEQSLAEYVGWFRSLSKGAV